MSIAKREEALATKRSPSLLVIPAIFLVIPMIFSCHSRESGNPEMQARNMDPR